MACVQCLSHGFRARTHVGGAPRAHGAMDAVALLRLGDAADRPRRGIRRDALHPQVALAEFLQIELSG